RHFLTKGLAAGLRPSPDRDPVAACRQMPAEDQAKALFLMNAQAMLPSVVRAPLEFSLGTEPAVLSVIMVVHNQFALTMASLASLRANFPRPIQLILVNSGSSDETQQIKRYVRGAEILQLDYNVGFLRGCNAGLHFATAEALLFLNNDVE